MPTACMPHTASPVSSLHNMQGATPGISLPPKHSPQQTTMRTHVPLKHYQKVHVIPEDQNLPLPPIPQIYIPTPKGWQPKPVQGLTNPHIIPPCPIAASYQSISKGYHNAATALANHKLCANAIVDDEMGRALEYRHLIKSNQKQTWFQSCANEFGRLAQGVGT
eukprot:4471024-Ditylum_brightwellii.AAC.1